MTDQTQTTEELVSGIEVLLRAQKRAIQSGDLKMLEGLAGHLQTQIDKINENQERPSQEQLEGIRSLYNDICIALETEKAGIGKQIATTKRNIRLVKAYSPR